MSRREAIVEAVADVPALPSAVADVVTMVQDPDVSLLDLTRVIEYEPGLTSNVLRLANSAYFGSPRQIHSVRDALLRLGMNTVYELVVATAVAPVARPAVRGYDLRPGDLWEHSVGVGLAAVRLAKLRGRTAPKGLFTGGLLIDVGKIVLGSFIEVDADEVLAAAFDQGLSFDAAEREVLGIDHAEVGALLLDQWNLPEMLVDIVRWHHEPEGCDRGSEAVDLVHAADICCMMGGIGAGTDGLHYHVSQPAVDRLRLTTKLVEQVVCDVFLDIAEVCGMFQAVPA